MRKENTLDSLDGQENIHPYWYTVGLLSAVIMGMSAFVISFNFMYGQVPMIFVLACSFSGMLLNTSLYLKDSAQKLSNFYAKLENNIENLFNHQALLSLCSAICVGFMAFRSYVDQFANLPTPVVSFFPIWPLSVVFSLANVVSTFVLFYDDSVDDITSTQTVEQKTWRTIVADAMTIKPSHFLCNAVGVIQSVMFSLINFSCMQQILSMCLPASPILVIVFSAALATALVVSECAFNCDKMLKLLSPSAPRARSYIDDLLLSLLILNGAANGWIALGDFRNLSALLRWSVVAIGLSVSCAVMKENIDDISSTVNNFSKHRWRFIPSHTPNTVAMIAGTARALSYLGGLYLLQPALLTKAFAAFPLATGVLFGSFLYSALPLAYHQAVALFKYRYTTNNISSCGEASGQFAKPSHISVGQSWSCWNIFSMFNKPGSEPALPNTAKGSLDEDRNATPYDATNH